MAWLPSIPPFLPQSHCPYIAIGQRIYPGPIIGKNYHTTIYWVFKKKIEYTMLFITKHFLSLFSILRLRWMDHWFKFVALLWFKIFKNTCRWPSWPILTLHLVGTVLTQILIIFSPSECDCVTDSDSRSGVCCVSTGICKFYKLRWNM